MKIINLSIGVFILLNSCTSNQKEFVKDMTILYEINDKVSFENKCKLTSTYDDQAPNEVNLKIGSSYTDMLLPGKILFDYDQRVKLTDLDIKGYNLNDANGKLYSLSQDDLLRIGEKSKLSKSLLDGFKSDDLTKFYNQLDTSVRNQFTFKDFNSQLLDFDLKNAKFSGFQLADSILGIGYKNSKNQIVFVYKWNSDSDKVFGFSVE